MVRKVILSSLEFRERLLSCSKLKELLRILILVRPIPDTQNRTQIGYWFVCDYFCFLNSAYFIRSPVFVLYVLTNRIHIHYSWDYLSLLISQYYLVLQDKFFTFKMIIEITRSISGVLVN